MIGKDVGDRFLKSQILREIARTVSVITCIFKILKCGNFCLEQFDTQKSHLVATTLLYQKQKKARYLPFPQPYQKPYQKVGLIGCTPF